MSLGKISSVAAGSPFEALFKAKERLEEEMGREVAPQATAAGGAQSGLVQTAAKSSGEGQGDSLRDQSRSSNLMASNFYDKDYEKSESVQARLDSLRQESQIQGKMNNLVSAISAEIGLMGAQRAARGSTANSGAADQYLGALKAKRAADRLRDENVYEESERNVKEGRESIEQAAAEAVAPKDANGNPLPGTEAAAAEGTPAPAPSPAPAPGPAPAPAPEAAPQAAAPAAAAPAQVSVDIKV